ncbi:MAG: DUF6263 family protein [Limisphaerales bacterium]
MSETRGQICCKSAAPKRRVHVNLQRFSGLLVLALLLGVLPARAEGPDDEYLQIYSLIQQADDLNTDGKPAPAKAKYEEAKAALTSFKTNYPYWNVKLVSYRLNYVAQKVAALSQKPPTVAAGATTPGAPEAQPEAKAAAETSTTQVKLLEPGAEPRQVLRLHPKPGDKQTLALTIKMNMESKMGEVETPAMKIPAIKMNLEATVKSVAENGDITCDLVMGDLSVSDEPGGTPAVAEAMKAAFSGIKGISRSGIISSRGFSKKADFKTPADSNPQARQLMDQMKDLYSQFAISLPEEAVGPGAKWEVRLPIKAQGMTIDQTVTYEVVRIEGDTLTTKSTIVQQAANQKVQNPAMPGVKLDLTKMTGRGTNELTFDLAKLLPIAGSARDHTETAMAMNMGGQKQPMTMKMDVAIQFESK